MIYCIISAVLLALLIFCAIIFARKKSKSKSLIINFSLFALGILLIILSLILALCSLKANASDAEWCAWASDMMNFYYTISLSAFFVLFLSGLIASGVEKADRGKRNGKSRKLRIVLSAVSSVFLLLLTMFGFFIMNKYVHLETFVLISGVGQALSMRLIDAIDDKQGIKDNKQGIKNEKK